MTVATGGPEPVRARPFLFRARTAAEPEPDLTSMVVTHRAMRRDLARLAILTGDIIGGDQPGAPYPVAVRAIGAILIAAGGIVMVTAFVRFPAEGTGLPFPTNPPSSRKVIIGGPYRYVRNPMYVAFTAANIGRGCPARS
jgi:protein-S-isoprenylcysteine O-methyltransferase Ste14